MQDTKFARVSDAPVLSRNDMGSASSVPVSLPEELLNEPFSDESDGPKPELIVPRRAFYFYIIPNPCHLINSYCLVGHSMMVGSVAHIDSTPQKHSSFCSVLSVYDTYGLDIALLYLGHLEDVKAREAITWTELYLTGSLQMMGITPGPVSMFSNQISVLCSQLSSELKQLDAGQPKCTEPLVRLTVELPLELLAKIVLSNRVSKAIRRLHAIYPSYYQMTKYRDDGNGHAASVGLEGSMLTVCNGLGYNSMNLNVYNLSISRQRSVFPPGLDNAVIEFSLDSYYAHVIKHSVSAARLTEHGGDGRASVLAKLKDIRKRLVPVTSDNIYEVAAWLLILRHSAKSLKEDEMADPCLDREKTERDLTRLLDLSTKEWSDM